jgi:DNA polymerase-3 subunit alpha
MSAASSNPASLDHNLETTLGATKTARRFAHLHQHTQYSLLDGAARVKDLLKWVAKTSSENPAVAMTDHGNMHGAVQFFKYATEMGVKPIIGYEAYVSAGSRLDRISRHAKGMEGGYYHLTLLAKDFQGYQNLCKLASIAYLEGFYVKPRIDREVLALHREGIIAMSGCLGAEVPNMILNDRLEEAEERLRWYLDTFKDDYYIEIQNHGLPEQQKVNPVLKAWARKYGIGMVATNDGHYVKHDDAYAHEVLLAIQTKALMSEDDRFKFPCNDFYVKSAEELEAVLPSAEWGDEIYDNSFAIAEKCNLELPIGSKRKYQMPALPIPQGRSMAEELRVQVYRGTQARFPQEFTLALLREYASVSLEALEPERRNRVLSRAGARPLEADLEGLYLLLAFLGTEWVELGLAAGEKYTQYPGLDRLEADSSERLGQGLVILRRAEYESGVIIRMGFPDYFLIVADFINWAKDHGIRVGPGRGSGAGSLVAYALKITNLDPLKYGLLFERFLNPDRISMPDFDVDFSDTRRGEVINYVRDKYGDDKVAMISTYGTMSSRACFKDVARVMELPFQEADKLSKLVPVVFGRALTLEKARETVPDIQKMLEESENARRVFEIAQNLEGLTRHSSVHASGVVIGRERLDNLVPLMRAGGDEGVVCQYDMSSVEDIGLIKMDFLGLRTLSFLEEAVRIIKDSKGVTLEPDDFPLDDPKTYEVISRGETKGIFQLEGGGITDAARKLKPRRIEDINALSALYRPGPMENIPAYIERHHGREQVRYDEGEFNLPTCEALLKPILEETYGIPVYQEQIMQIASAVAGYSLGQSDLLRRCVAKGTPVVDAQTGRRVPIEAVKPGMQVLSLAPDYRLSSVPVQEVMHNGVMRTYKVRTRAGREVVLTHDHPLLTVTGWKHLCDLEVGDAIAVPSSLPVFGVRQPSEARAKLLGYLIGDGGTLQNGKPTANFYNSDEAVLADYERFAAEFGVLTTRYVHSTTHVTTVTARGETRDGKNALTKLVIETELCKLAHEKRVPLEVFEYDRAALQHFIGALWATDGSVERTRLSYSSASKALVDDIAHLLLRFGINTIRRHSKTTHRDKFELVITDQLDVQRFANAFAAHMTGYKSAKLETLALEAAARSRNTSIYDVPAAVGHTVKRAKTESKRSWREAGELIGVAGNHLSSGLNLQTPNRALSRHRVHALATAFSSEALRVLGDNDVLWDVILEITDAGETEVYDLAVPPFANFVCADVIVHNSMGKKKVDEMARERVKFVEGAKKVNKIPEKESENLFNILEKFANYGFNKSHSAAYAFISFQTAYIKAHYPVEFMASLLTVERRNSEKVAEYINDARRTRLEDGGFVQVLPPDINRSNPDFKVQGNQILFGLFAVKGLGEETVLQILEERDRSGAFKSLANFCSRMHGAGLNRRALENLVKAGAFDAFGAREAVLESVEESLEYAAGQASMASQGMDSLFGMALVAPEPPLRAVPAPRDELEARARAIEQLQFEKEAVGLYISGHPLEHYPGMLEAASCKVSQIEPWFHTSSAPKGYKGRKRALLSGMVSGIQRKPTKSGGMMARFILTDDAGAAEMVAFSRAYDKINLKLREDAPALVIVELEPDGEEGVRATVEDLVPYEEAKEMPRILALEVDLDNATPEAFSQLDHVLQIQDGVPNIPIRVRVTSIDGFEDWELDSRATASTLERLHLECPWLKVGLGIDGDKVLAKFAPAPKPWERGGAGQGQRTLN